MVFIFPMAIWFGLATIASLFATLSLGIAVRKFKKNVFKYHMLFAFLTALMAIIHMVLAYLLFSGVVI
ncbi:MAG: hypothetical protein V1678_04500 [Candidatus Aenigmatarchaeota archaeon]